MIYADGEPTYKKTTRETDAQKQIPGAQEITSAQRCLHTRLYHNTQKAEFRFKKSGARQTYERH